MILANLRERIAATDVDMVIQLLSRGDAAHRQRLARLVQSQGIDALLDDPELPELLRGAPELDRPTASLFVYVVVRQALRAAGVDDRPLADYVAALMFEFGMRGRAFRIARFDDEEYRYLVDLVADVSSEPGRRGFLLRAHLGNFSLWLAGVFPDHITAREERRGGPGLRYYEELGAQGFRLAADHRMAQQLDLAGLYRRVAGSFSGCALTGSGGWR